MLTRWKPFEEMLGLPFPIDRLIRDEWFNDGGKEGFVPAVDVRESKEGFELRFDIPGMKREDIHVAVEGDTVTVSGERKTEVNEKKDGWARVERSYGMFRRSFRLPDTADVAHVKAAYKDGVLQLDVPRTARAQPRTIDIKAE